MADNGNSPAGAFSAQLGVHDFCTGLTKRELIAAMAMQGLLSRGCAQPSNASRDAEDSFVSSCVRMAAKHADALLAELEKTNDH